MKNLANCKPSEFLKQTNRIRKAAEKWLTGTGILDIRKRLPEIQALDETMDEAEKARVIAENRRREEAQMQSNFSAILDAILEEHPDETMELLALMCFIEPKDADDHPIDEYLMAIAEMLSNQAVISFFISLARLEKLNISAA